MGGSNKYKWASILVLILVLMLGGCQPSAPSAAPQQTKGVAVLSWLPPTENTDGSVLTDLAGYRVYYGVESHAYTKVITIENVGIATYVVESLDRGYIYYFSLTAFNEDGLESEYSAERTKSFLPM